MSLYETPLNTIIAGLLLLVGVYSAARGARLLGRGLRRAQALEIVRGIRGCVIAFVAGVFALGILSGHMGFIILGAIVLGEELYETGVLAVIIRFAERGAM